MASNSKTPVGDSALPSQKFEIRRGIDGGAQSLLLGMMSFTLVVLAAGMGSRYGGLKQIEPVGPSGETVLDYAVFDACRAGFERVVFVIRRDFEALFRETIASRYAGRIDVGYAFQSREALPPGFKVPAAREKPWGTGHALWCARDVVKQNFAVINADDFYGADSFQQLAKFLGGAPLPDARSQFAMVGFRLANTLSQHGAVSRGICAVVDRDALRSIVEQSNISLDDVGPGKNFTGDEIVSMNCWGFTPAVFARLDAQLNDFLAEHEEDTKAEFYLPAAVSYMVACGEADVHVLATEDTWFGVTYRADKPLVQKAIADLVQAGEYPARLF